MNFNNIKMNTLPLLSADFYGFTDPRQIEKSLKYIDNIRYGMGVIRLYSWTNKLLESKSII